MEASSILVGGHPLHAHETTYMYYIYRQNNSYGLTTPPAKHVVIEADDMAEANNKFLTIDGCYFDVDYSIDCPCCGCRWDYTSEYNDKGLEEHIEFERKWSWNIRENDIPCYYILRKNGQVDIID